jgi:hypothetical protein
MFSNRAIASTLSFILFGKFPKTEVLIETLRENQFNTLQQSDPKLVWLKGAYKFCNKATTSTNAVDPISVSSIHSSSSSNNTIMTTTTHESSSNQKHDEIFVIDDDTQVQNKNLNSDNTESADDMNAKGNATYSTSTLVPQERIEDEIEMAKYLDVLYDYPLTYAYREISIGGESKRVHAFHYPAVNIIAPKNNCQKREYIDEQEDTVLYRWELKAVLCCRLYYYQVKIKPILIINAFYFK